MPDHSYNATVTSDVGAHSLGEFTTDSSLFYLLFTYPWSGEVVSESERKVE